MDDLISRKAAIEEFEEMVTSVSVYGESAEARYANNARLRFIEKLADIPSVDATPVKHGRWINRGLEPIKCSVCGITPDAMKPIVVQVGMPYCPYCGAKMDLEE